MWMTPPDFGTWIGEREHHLSDAPARRVTGDGEPGVSTHSPSLLLRQLRKIFLFTAKPGDPHRGPISLP
jgi:hypothetical protein